MGADAAIVITGHLSHSNRGQYRYPTIFYLEQFRVELTDSELNSANSLRFCY